MIRIKQLVVNIITAVLFVGLLLIGMTTDWWMTEGRKTPLDGVTAKTVDEAHADEASDAHADEDAEEHEQNTIVGSSTVQDALDLGISEQALTELLAGPIDDPSASIKELAQARGLQFGVIKDALNAMLSE